MAQRPTTILQDFVKISCSYKSPMRWQGRQGLLAPVEPLLQCGGNRETAPKSLLKRNGCSQRKVPAMASAVPTPPRLDPTQLRLGYRIKRTNHANKTRWGEIQATGQCGF